MKSELAHAWRINCGMNELLLKAIPDAALGDRYAPRTRSVASQFAHMHNVRLSHLERRFPGIACASESFGRGAEPKRGELKRALGQSDKAIAQALAEAEELGSVKSWKGPPPSFLGYFLAHEAHHRGLAMVCLRVCGTKLPKDTGYGLWYWSKDWAKGWRGDWGA